MPALTDNLLSYIKMPDDLIVLAGFPSWSTSVFTADTNHNSCILKGQLIILPIMFDPMRWIYVLVYLPLHTK